MAGGTLYFNVRLEDTILAWYSLDQEYSSPGRVIDDHPAQNGPQQERKRVHDGDGAGVFCIFVRRNELEQDYCTHSKVSRAPNALQSTKYDSGRFVNGIGNCRPGYDSQLFYGLCCSTGPREYGKNENHEDEDSLPTKDIAQLSKYYHRACQTIRKGL